MEKRRIVKRRNVLLSVLLVALAMVIMLVSFAPMNASAAGIAASDEKDISTDSITGYFMYIGIKDKNFNIIEKKWMKSEWGAFKAWKRTDKNVTVIFRFIDVPYTDEKTNEQMTIIIHTVASLNFPGSETLGKDVKLNNFEPLKINIAEKFYNYFNYAAGKGADFTKVKISVFSGGRAEPLHKCKNVFECEKICWVGYPLDVSFKTEKLPPGSNDPTSPDWGGGLGDGNGLTPSTPEPTNQHWFEKFYNWLTGIFKWKLSFADFKTILIIACIVIVWFVVYKFICWCLK